LKKVAIVGSEGRFWTPEQRTKVVKKVRDILYDESGYPDGVPPTQIVLVSGGCGGATSEKDKLKFNGGVDEWSETVADLLGVPKEIKYPEINSFEDVKVVKSFGDGNISIGERRKGYKTRNIEIAEVCTVLYCIDPADRDWSGGRWTYEYLKIHFPEKEAKLVIIE
jgi:hypothetical protein